MYTTLQSFLPAWLGWMVSIKFLLVVVVGTVLFWQFRPYLTYMNDMVNMAKSLMDATIGVVSATSTNIVDSTAKGSEVVVDKISGKKKKTQGPVPEPDDSTSSVQGGAAGGFCLAGEWKGVRSCVRVNAGKECSSGKVFSTKEQCVTPESRG